MVDHEIDHQVVALGQFADVVPVPEGGVHRVVVDDGKPAVAGRGIEGQDVQPADDPVEMFGQHAFQLLQIAAQTVRIRDQHDFVGNLFHGRSPFHFGLHSGQLSRNTQAASKLSFTLSVRMPSSMKR